MPVMIKGEKGMKLVVGYESARNRGQALEAFTRHCNDFGFFSLSKMKNN